MRTSPHAALFKLPRRKRIELAEQLWVSACPATTLSAVQKSELMERWTEYASGKARTLTLAELKAQLQK